MNISGLICCRDQFLGLRDLRIFVNDLVLHHYIRTDHGMVKDDEGTVSTLIGRDTKDRKKMSARVSDGKTAITHYRVLERFKDYTYIECRLETGRTHQIRVHMAYIGHPLVGDMIYGNRKNPFGIDTQCLHAYILGFNQPTTGEYIETCAPLPDYFKYLLEKLG